MIEYDILTSDWDLKDRFNKGWELVKVFYVSEIKHESTSEPVQMTWVSTGYGGAGGSGGSGGGYQQPQQQYVTRTYPVAIRNPRFVVKRTAAAKILYEKSLHENKSANP